jgi:hypothetical protein
MTNPQFIDSPGGRLALVTSAFALITAGGLAMASRDPLTMLVGVLATLAIAVGFIVSTGLATRDFGGHAVAMLIALPFLATVYFAGLTVIPGRGLGAGLPLVALGLAALGRGLAGSVRASSTLAHQAQARRG